MIISNATLIHLIIYFKDSAIERFLSSTKRRSKSNVVYNGSEYKYTGITINNLVHSYNSKSLTELKLSNEFGLFDELLKNHNNFKGGTARVINLDLDSFDDTDASSARINIDNTYQVLQLKKYNSREITLTLGTPLDTSLLIPIVNLEERCPHEFKGAVCKYIGAGTSCSKTFSNCRRFKNSHNFGGIIGEVI